MTNKKKIEDVVKFWRWMGFELGFAMQLTFLDDLDCDPLMIRSAQWTVDNLAPKFYFNVIHPVISRDYAVTARELPEGMVIDFPFNRDEWDALFQYYHTHTREMAEDR